MLCIMTDLHDRKSFDFNFLGISNKNIIKIIYTNAFKVTVDTQTATVLHANRKKYHSVTKRKTLRHTSTFSLLFPVFPYARSNFYTHCRPDYIQCRKLQIQ